MTKLTRIEEVKKMTADEAIKELKRGTQQSRSTNNQRLREALELGIEALRKECQLFPQPLDDKELREIQKDIQKMLDNDQQLELGVNRGHWERLLPTILALLQPKIEELKQESEARHEIIRRLTVRCEEAEREERERIIKEIEGHACLGEANYTQTVLLKGEILINPGYLWWQALKGGE